LPVNSFVALFPPVWGGNLFFIPVWVLGVLWVVLGLVHTFEARG
jgi:hypothetical protein